MSLVFKPIDLAQQAAYQRRFARCSQLPSDYSFVNLWGWGRHYGLEWAWEDQLVWLRQVSPEPAWWAPIGNWQAIEWSAVLDSISVSGSRFIRVPEDLVRIWQQLPERRPQVAETREQWDYLYNIEELTSLKGNRYHKKKNLVSQFEKNYAYTYHILGPELVAKTLSLQEDWCTWRDCDSDDMLTAENEAIVRILTDWNKFADLTGGALEVQDRLIAYTIAEILPDQSLLIHFEKGCPEFKGAYQAINQKNLNQAPPSCTIVNRAQDLGDEGLRKAKLSYHPVDYIRKYQVGWQ